MRKANLFLASIILCIGLYADASAQKPTSCGTDVTNLSVSIYKYTDGTLTSTYNIQPDQVYTDGSPVPYTTQKTGGNQITAQFQIRNCSYDFTLNLNFSPRSIDVNVPQSSTYPGWSTTSKFFNFDRVASVPITDWNNPAFVSFCGGALDIANVVHNSNGTYKYDNYAGCGKDPDTYDANNNLIPGRYFVRRAAVFQLTDRYLLHFQYSPLENKYTIAAGTAYVKVYHTDATTWELSPDQALLNGEVAPWSALVNWSANSSPYVATYSIMPFKMIVKRLQ